MGAGQTIEWVQVGVGLYGLLALLQRRVRQRHAVRRFAENVRHSLGEHPRRQHLDRSTEDATTQRKTMRRWNHRWNHANNGQRHNRLVSIDVPLADGGGRPWEYA